MMAMGLGFAWLIAANFLALVPSRDNLWTRAYVLIAIGIPLLGYITYTNGPLLGMVFLVAGCSVLRWPVIYLGRWIRRVMAKSES